MGWVVLGGGHLVPSFVSTLAITSTCYRLFGFHVLRVRGFKAFER